MDNKNYFKALTGYRAVAAFMIFGLHNRFLLFKNDSFACNFCLGLGVGVPLFYALSGFLIYSRYHRAEVSTSFYKKYMVNRFARIYPVYFVLTTITLLFNYKAAAFSPHWLKVYLLNISFLRGFFEKYAFTLVAPGWSLTVEETFYLLAPILFLLAADRIKNYLIAYLVLFGLGWLMSFISVYLLHGFFWSDHTFMLLGTFFGNSLSITVGILVGVLHKRLNIVNFKYFTAVGVVGLICCLLVMSGLKDLSWSWLFVYLILTAPFIGAVIWGLLREDTFLSRILATNVFQILGKSSYVFYLIHYGILLGILDKFVSKNVFVHFIIFIAISIAIWHFFEEPVNEFIRRKFRN